MQPIKKIVIVAGEASGDHHAASFVRHLKENHNNIEFSGIGGVHMKNEGVKILTDLSSCSSTGLSGILVNLNVFIKAFKQIKEYLKETKPDLLVLVDYPEFNLRLAKYAKLILGIKIVYYISPQIWAWKAKRINIIKECIDHMAVILPFEKKFYENADVKCSFVGNPLVKKIIPCNDVNKTRLGFNLPLEKKIIAMLPGSRKKEIENHMPVLAKTAENLSAKCKELHFVIPVASTINPDLIKSYLNNSNFSYTIIVGKAIEVVSCCDFAVVASGTASLECALLLKPMCIIYKSSILTYMAAMKLIKVKYLGLCNLLQNEMIVPELLQYDCNAIELTKMISELLTNKDLTSKMQLRLQQLKNSMSLEQADRTISQVIELELGLNIATS